METDELNPTLLTMLRLELVPLTGMIQARYTGTLRRELVAR